VSGIWTSKHILEGQVQILRARVHSPIHELVIFLTMYITICTSLYYSQIMFWTSKLFLCLYYSSSFSFLYMMLVQIATKFIGIISQFCYFIFHLLYTSVSDDNWGARSTIVFLAVATDMLFEQFLIHTPV